MRCYYLDDPMTEQELAWVSEDLGEPLEQVRIPFVFPADTASRPLVDADVAIPHPKRAGLEQDAGKRVVLVAPADMHWYGAITDGIRELTGALPWLVQTPRQREQISNPGDLRVIDMEGLAGGLR